MQGLTQKEVVSVIRMAETVRNQAMIAIAYRHGMRASEVCGLKLADVDLKNGEIAIRRLKGSLKTTQHCATSRASRSCQRKDCCGRG
jgi:type 1 fimbriae regulatory protein FimB